MLPKSASLTPMSDDPNFLQANPHILLTIGGCSPDLELEPFDLDSESSSVAEDKDMAHSHIIDWFTLFPCMDRPC